MASTEQELGRIAGILERVVAGAERDRAEMLNFIRDTNAKLDDLKETVDRQPEAPTRAEVDAIRDQLQKVFNPVVGGPEQPGFDARIRKIEEAENKRNGALWGLGLLWAGLTAWMTANRFPKLF